MQPVYGALTGLGVFVDSYCAPRLAIVHAHEPVGPEDECDLKYGSHLITSADMSSSVTGFMRIFSVVILSLRSLTV